MRRDLAYLCAPVAAPTRALLKDNLWRAKLNYDWLRPICRRIGIDLIAPWLLAMIHGTDDDSDPNARERALQECENVARRCDGVILTGYYVSEGMGRELAACPGWVCDLTSLEGECVPELLSPIEYGRAMWTARQLRQREQEAG